MAPTGGGKSFFLVNLGYGALAAGKNVIHYSFELSETHVGNRYDSRITGIPTKELRNRMVEAEAQLVRFNGGQLYIKEYPPKVATINTIKFHMGRLLSNGFDPDLIIIDYGDLMKSRRGYDQKRFELESIFEDLRALSMEMKLPIWTATQSNREGFNDDVITIDKVGEAINKAMVVDFFGTFSQRKFHIGKNRMGQANVNYNIDMDPARAFIDLNDDQSAGFSVGDKVNNMLSGGDKMRSFYHDVKEEAQVDMERLTITRTRRYGNSEIQINNVYSVPRTKTKIDKVISMANDMITKAQPITNEEIEYEVIIARENGTQEFIHRVEKLGTRSI